MAKIKFTQHGNTFYKEVEELFFHYPNERGYGYIFQITDGEIQVGTKGLENFERCQKLNQAGKMICEHRHIMKKIRIHTIGKCTECGNTIEINSNGLTRCPHCNSLYNKDGTEVYI